jgi:hypothetical protein
MSKIADALLHQFDRTWEMLRCSIERLTDEQWRTAPNERMVPARWAYHAIRSADVYAGENRESFSLTGLAGGNWEAAPEDLPSRQDILKYLGQVEAKMRARISSLSEEQLLGPTGFPWTGESILEQMIYILRHIQYHLGELAAALRSHGANQAEWK